MLTILFKIPLQKLKGGALSYVIVMILVISAVLSMYLLYRYYRVMNVDIQYWNMRLDENVDSGVLLIENNVFNPDYTKTISKPLFEESVDTVFAKRKSWGVFDIISLKSSHRGIRCERLFLSGVDFKKCSFPALYLADKNRYLSLSGRKGIVGNCVLPPMGIRKGYAEGVGFYADSLVYGTITESDKKLPEIATKFSDFEKLLFSDTDSLVDFQSITYVETLFNSFLNNTIVIKGKKIFNPAGIKLKGNIILTGDSLLILDKSMSVTDVIVKAQVIQVKSGFSGKVQLFATNNITIEPKAKLLYPSFVMVNAKLKTEKITPAITIKSGSVIYGGLSVVDNNDESNEVICKMEKGSLVSGVAYIKGAVDLEGAIFGSLYTEMFKMKTRVASYENHLSDVVINSRAVKSEFATVDIFEKKENTKCIYPVE